MGGMGDMDEILKQAMRGFGFSMGGDEEPGGVAPGGAFQNNGRDLLDEVEIPLRDAYFGTTHTVKFSSNVKCEKCGGFGTADGKEAPVCPRCHGSGVIHSRSGIFMSESVCPDCNGLGRTIKKKCSQCDGTGVQNKSRTLEVKIPAGVQNGTRLRFAGKGEAGMLGGAAGDFFVDVRVMPDSRFARRGDELFAKATVPFATLALGGSIDLSTIDGKNIEVKITAGTQVGERLRVRGKGMPRTGQLGAFGDLYLEIATEVPKNLADKQKKALEEFAGAVKKSGKKNWF
jgi:molecular chaperone DnaJ